MKRKSRTAKSSRKSTRRTSRSKSSSRSSRARFDLGAELEAMLGTRKTKKRR